ncbi:MAG: hypothetical protein ACW98U_14620 [Candidatus Thorarchaeota archaeon]
MVIVTAAVAMFATISFFQPELIGFNPVFDAAYGVGLLTGFILLFSIILRK